MTWDDLKEINQCVPENKGSGSENNLGNYYIKEHYIIV